MRGGHNGRFVEGDGPIENLFLKLLFLRSKFEGANNNTNNPANMADVRFGS
jgi:hypothetical protein